MTQADTRLEARPTVDLTNCDREAIHHIGGIQPIGFLIAIDPNWTVVRVSANVGNHMSSSAEALLGARFIAEITEEAAHAIRNRLSVLNGEDAIERMFAMKLQDGGLCFDLAVHRAGRDIIIEGEPSQALGALNAGTMVRAMLARVQGKKSLVSEAVRLVHALTGFDRVMIYRFHPDQSGEVIAERTRPGLERYLGLRYPAEDIPQQARALLLRNPVRLVADVGAVPSPILPRTDEPLDLSLSMLRAHSVMHVEYLKNMGVGATMTIALVRDGALWGLISCHHMTARHVGFEQRTTADLFAQMLSFLLEKRERDELIAYEAHARQLTQKLIAAVTQHGSAGECIAELAEQVGHLMPCDGIAVYVDGNLTLDGVTPTPAEFALLTPFLDHHAAGQIYATNQLGDVCPPAFGFADRMAGMLAIPLSRSPHDHLVFFRRAMAQAVDWAGEPGKVLVSGPHGDRLTPRKSFKAWREIIKGRSAPWVESEQRAAEALRTALLEVVVHLAGMTEKESRAAAQRQDLLIAELNHRVRNILGLIRGLVAHSRTSATDVDMFATILGDRVHALARAHDQITAKNWGAAPLATLIASEAAVIGSETLRVHASGPNILLQPLAFSTMALVIHELMTNAVKHGALSNKKGQITIIWELTPKEDVVLHWIESGGPAVADPTRRGFGSTIIQRSVPHELAGEVSVDYAPGGLRARFVLPGRQAVVGGRVSVVAPIAAVERPAVQLSGPVLLVEDNMIIALDAEDILMSLGAARVLVASTVADALRLLNLETPSFAVLDVNLGSETIWPVASRLRALGVPLIFATGYGDGVEYPPEMRPLTIITKPYTRDAIAQAIAGMAPLPQS